MSNPPSFPYTQVAAVQQWFNFHHTIASRAVPLYVTPTGSPGAQQAQSLQAIIEYCLAASPPERLSMLGSAWSLSNALDPGNVLLDPGVFNQLAEVDPSWITPAYRDDAAKRGGVPIIAQGGIEIGRLNHYLGKSGLALATSGAADGQRLAGCIGTGTHGSALPVAAVHDTIVGVHLVTGPNQAVFLQPTQRRFTPALAAWLQSTTAIPTQDLADDELYNAARVAIGSLGFVHSVIVEAVPLYQLSGVMIERPLEDPDVWHAITTLDTSRLDPHPSPFNFAVNVSPYASGSQIGMFVSLLWKQTPVGPFADPGPAVPMIASDTSRLLSSLIGRIDQSWDAATLETFLVDMTQKEYKAGAVPPVFPGQIFGPTTLPPGNGRSSEIAVDHAYAEVTLKTILAALRAQANQGHHLLGALGVRFAPASDALIGMNIHPMNMYVELATLGSPDITAVHQACWAALQSAKIPYTCHWGQAYGMDPTIVAAYYGDRATRWKAARAKILPTPALRAVFASPLLASVGLG